MTYLDVNLLEGLNKLLTLDLSANALKTVGIVPTLPNWKVFNLQGNSLTEVPELKHTFLHTLFLEGNNIPHYYGNRLPATLRHLRMHKNSIEYLSDDAFSGLTSLKTLQLFRNNLKKLPFVGHLTSLTNLKLHYNQIDALDKKQLEGLGVVTITLENNNLQCDRRLCWVLRDTYPYNLQDARCASPAQYLNTLITSLPEYDICIGK